MTITRRGFVSAAAALAAPQAVRRPNILLVMADSWRGQALPAAGDTNLTAPNLSRLAAEGVYCSRAYTSYPVCCPSRAAVLTGRFPHAAGVRQNHTRLPLREATLSAALKEAGYRTGYIGKWHLDGRDSPGFVPPNRRRGFDYWAAFNLAHKHYGAVYFRNEPEPIPFPGFEPDAETDLALDFLRQKSDQPFFLYLSFVAPHAPYTPPAKYDRKNAATELNLRANVPERSDAGLRQDLAGYYGLCAAVDDNLGRLLAELDRQRLTQDTIVIFTSDHGHMMGSHGLDAIDVPYEEATRIPLLVRYPRRYRKGTEYQGLVSNVDFAPTILALCGVGALEGAQGTDLSGVLGGGEGIRPESIYAEGALGSTDEWRMLVRGLDKLVVNAAFKPTHLFNLGQDPYEMKNLVEEGAERRKLDELGALLRRWAFRTGDRIEGAR